MSINLMDLQEEENAVSWLVRRSLLARFEAKGQVPYRDYVPQRPKPNVQPSEDEPVRGIKTNLLLPGGYYVVAFEEFRDGSWSVFFEDFPSIIGGSNDSWEDAIDALVELIADDLQDIQEQKGSSSPYYKKRYAFLEEVFKV